MITNRGIGFLIVLVLANILGFAQKREAHWIFGDSIGLDFKGGSPRAFTAPGNFRTYEAVASVSDPETGELLFYTEGDTIWNKKGERMLNATGLTGLPLHNFGNFSSTASGSQGTVIVPMPNDAEKYYVFSLSSNEYYLKHVFEPWMYPTDRSGFLYYSIVDMTLNGGLGDVIPGKKGIPLDTVTNFTEHMLAIPGNSCNAWLVLMDPQKKSGEISRFKTFEITDTGIKTTPTISNVFTVTNNLMPIAYNTYSLVGKLAVSPDNKKIAITVSTSGVFTKLQLALFDFNIADGVLSNPLVIESTTTDELYYGVCFSADNNKLYAAKMFGTPGTIKQFDLSKQNADSILKSKTDVAIFYGSTDLKRGIDDRIYYGYRNRLDTNVLDTKIGVINYPNLSGSACQPDSSAITLANEFWGFPTSIASAFVDTMYSRKDASVCIYEGGEKGFDFQITAKGNVLWNDGDTSSSRLLEKSGTYWVRYLEDKCTMRVDTINLVISEAPMANIRVEGFVLSTTLPFKTYQWFLNAVPISGATDSSYTVKENGKYTVAVENENGCLDTSKIYVVSNVNSIAPILISTDKIKVYPNPVQDVLTVSTPIKVNLVLCSVDGKTLIEKNNSTQINLQGLAKGTYFLRVIGMDNNVLIKTEKITKFQ